MPAGNRYAGPIVDAHHHIWRQADLPWLTGEMVPRIFGPYEAIQRDYPVEEYIADAQRCGITGSVYVQANWPTSGAVEEVRWLAEVNRATGWPTAVIGSADLFDPGAVEVMREQAALSPLLRGTRLQLHWHEQAEFRFASAPDSLLDPVFLANIAALEELGWLFELQVFPGQMADAVRLVSAFPRTTFVLVHAGMLVDRDTATVRTWLEGMRALAGQPNVVVKLTGQGTFVHRVDPELIALVSGHVLELFGPRRTMFGTNFPIEAIWTPMADLVDAWRDALSGLPAEEQSWVFAENARRVYGLPAPG
ncbi:MAG TPA: amidohydrolase family protein [Modestobacter sp.]|nr:amidohydrolase family protein [Modestobacter sp.]